MSFWYIWLNAVTAPRGKTRFVPASYINSPVSYTVSQVTLSFLLCSDIIILSVCFTFLLKLCKHLFSGWGWGFSVHIDLIDTDMIRGATGWMSVPRCHGKGQITVLTVSKVSCHCQCFYSGKQDLSGCRRMNRLLCQSLSINTNRAEESFTHSYVLSFNQYDDSIVLIMWERVLLWNSIYFHCMGNKNEGEYMSEFSFLHELSFWSCGVQIFSFVSSYGVKECEDYVHFLSKGGQHI